MKPKFWGPKFWYTIHCIAFHYPNNPTEEEKKNAFNFFTSLSYLIPCSKCKIHYQSNLNLEELKSSLDSTMSLFAYTVKLHNNVNILNNKPTLTVQQAIDKFKKNSSSVSLNSPNNVSLLLIFVIIVIMFLCYNVKFR